MGVSHERTMELNEAMHRAVEPVVRDFVLQQLASHDPANPNCSLAKRLVGIEEYIDLTVGDPDERWAYLQAFALFRRDDAAFEVQRLVPRIIQMTTMHLTSLLVAAWLDAMPRLLRQGRESIVCALSDVGIDLLRKDDEEARRIFAARLEHSALEANEGRALLVRVHRALPSGEVLPAAFQTALTEIHGVAFRAGREPIKDDQRAAFAALFIEMQPTVNAFRKKRNLPPCVGLDPITEAVLRCWTYGMAAAARRADEGGGVVHREDLDDALLPRDEAKLASVVARHGKDMDVADIREILRNYLKTAPRGRVLPLAFEAFLGVGLKMRVALV